MKVEQLSKTQQLKAFIALHKGEEFSASGLAKALGWTKKKSRKTKGGDGKPEEIVYLSHNSKAVVRIAKKVGAKVEYQKSKKVGEDLVGHYTIRV